ncbi:MAG TPA: F0F1 ATP synthase subunit epsilon [Armatimonadota bacterium]|jgi:F-type H+-transporting ATPase subunit epsilon
MPDKFQLTVVTPERTVLDAQVVSVMAPGGDGYFGVLAHHAPMLAEVGVGRLTATDEADSVTVMAVSGGFAEVRNNTMTVLADSAELRHDIDVARAEEALKRARLRLGERSADIDISRAEAALSRALNRVDTARR